MISGYRITLTYNLFVSEQVGGILQQYPTADPELYPLFERVRKLLEEPDFLSKGMLEALNERTEEVSDK
jgi:hypothetical protein